ncbi:MAG: hypothetical protein QXP91_07880 [Candidatus Methanomethylicia archaeon]
MQKSVEKIELYITPITISELTYIVSRIYELAGIEKLEDEALNFIKWLTMKVKTVEIMPDIAVKV